MTASPLVDARRPVRLTIWSAPRSKKSHNRTFDIGRKCSCCRRGARTVVMPSEAWTKWCDHAAPRIRAVMAATGIATIDYRVNCAAIFYQDADRADAVGLYQGLADLLQKAGVVVNDRLIRSWNNSVITKDSARPRVELVLTPIGEE